MILRWSNLRLCEPTYGLTALPDGRLIVAEKTRGLSLIERDGQHGAPLTGTPRVWDAIFTVQGAWLNLGIMLDIALHPDYQENGWVYISHTDRCWLDCGSIVPVTMVRVLRGRIKDNEWVDQEVIWSVHRDHYTPVPDGVAAGRLAFDKDNHFTSQLAVKIPMTNCTNWIRPSVKFTACAMMAACRAITPILLRQTSEPKPRPATRCGALAIAPARVWPGIQ